MCRLSRLAFALSLSVAVSARSLFAQTAPVTQTPGVSTPAPIAAAAERAAADSPRTTPAGATFTIPSGWSMTTRGPMVVLEPPEPDSHLVIVDVLGAKVSDAAIAAAWAAYRPDAKRPLKLVQPQAALNGWEERKFYEYETSPNERATVFGQAWRADTYWVAILVDATDPTYEKRAAQHEYAFIEEPGKAGGS
jgi:hypothetical protein